MKRVAVIPLKQFLEAKGDAELLTQLATSVERAATVKRLRARADSMRGMPLHGYAMRALNEEADAIERGEHV